jgi:hypothetical protein
MTTVAQSFTRDRVSRRLDLIRAEHDRQFLLSTRLIELATRSISASLMGASD